MRVSSIAQEVCLHANLRKRSTAHREGGRGWRGEERKMHTDTYLHTHTQRILTRSSTAVFGISEPTIAAGTSASETL